MERFIPNTLPFSSKKLPVRVVLSYTFDYGIIVALAAIYALIDRIVTPFSQPFSLRNYTIQYPFAVKERIPIPIAFVICILVPMAVISVYTLVIDGLFSHHRKNSGISWSGIYRLKDRLWELNCGILGLFLAEGAALVITGSLKNLAGKPRPDLIDRCRPVDGSADPLPFGLSNRTICTQTDQAIMADGFRSFPSGHSSGAFAGLFYLSLYLAGKLHVLDNRGEVWRTLLVLIPTLAASCVAMSRIMDARHHPFDVLFGSAMGILVAWASYRQYFPPLSETWRKGRAYPIRTWGAEMKRAPRSDNDMIQKGSEVEPFRTGGAIPGSSFANPSDLEELHAQNTEYGGNVFREQIHRSQRQRTTGNDGADETNSYANRITTADGAQYMSPRHRNDDWSATSSSEEDLARPHSTHADAFEMQTQDRISAASMQIARPESQPPLPPHHRASHQQNDQSPTAYRHQTVRTTDTEAQAGQAAAWSPLESHPGERVLA